MSTLQVIAISLCALTAAAVGICGELSRKRLRSPFTAGPVVRFALDLKAIAFMGLAIELAHGGTITLGGLSVLFACALTSVAVLASMLGRCWREAVEAGATRARLQAQAQDAYVVREAVQETVTPLAEAVMNWALSDPPPYVEAGGARGLSLTPERHASGASIRPGSLSKG